MSRVVYVGGFANGHGSVEKVGEALGAHFEEVRVFSFSDFVKGPEVIQKAAQGATLMTHSAGALSLTPDVRPSEACLLNPPLPRHIGGLIARSVLKTGRLYIPSLGIHRLADYAATSAYSRSATAELVSHPVANLGQLPKISRFDAIDTAANAGEVGIRTRLTWTDHDAYFTPTAADLGRASESGVSVTMLEGEHDQVVLHPAAFLRTLLNETS